MRTYVCINRAKQKNKHICTCVSVYLQIFQQSHVNRREQQGEGWRGGQMDGWIHGWMDGWMDGTAI